MQKFTQNSIFLFAMFAVLLFTQSCQDTDPVDFSTQIKPILNNKCITCHGGVKKNGGFSLLFEDEAFAETESGKPAIISGDASGSELIRRLHEDDPELRMPYEKPKLSDEEIDLLTRWIDQGAEWGEHWAYSLPEEIEVPVMTAEAGFAPESASEFLKNNIDNFVLARLESEKDRAEPSR
ncbi:c-type cytochrome domain-containing protein [Maribacter halichondriae]|uniref:c-type cytochrome domain-containing protein n=1 Tax=Maribacter halichondriae TaxID=2980554 RepID=UPI002358E397|nr:c-type cytochrome domain-containing protein [Maribacter sp. Hal144]